MQKTHNAGQSTRGFLWRLKHQKYLIMMVIPAIILVFIFNYMPIWGLLISFVDYNPGLGISGSRFVGFKYFLEFFRAKDFWFLIRNSFAISLLNIVFGMSSSIVFAIFLSELPWIKYKKTVQTISYLPHFISYVVVANVFITILSPDGGIVNNMLVSLGLIKEPILFFTQPKLFWWLVAGINVWKEMGWSAIIYLAAISGIDTQLYEAAMVDGAGRFRRIWHITLPGIMSTVIVLLILAVPDLLNAGFDPSYLLGNSMVSDYSKVLDTYVYTMGLQQGRYSFATAVGLVRMVVAVTLILSANSFAKRVSEHSLF